MIASILSRLQFWYAKRFYRLDIEYDMHMDMSNPDMFAVKLLKKYPETVIGYTNIGIDCGNLSYDFIVIANPKGHDTTTKSFKNFTSNVFRSIITNSIEHAGNNLNNENRTIDTDQSNQERTLHEESDSISQVRVSTRKPRKKAVRRNKALHS